MSLQDITSSLEIERRSIAMLPAESFVLRREKALELYSDLIRTKNALDAQQRHVVELQKALG